MIYWYMYHAVSENGGGGRGYLKCKHVANFCQYNVEKMLNSYVLLTSNITNSRLRCRIRWPPSL